MIDVLKDTEKQIAITYNTREEALDRLEYITEKLVEILPKDFVYTNRSVRSEGGGKTVVVFTIELV